MPRPPSLPGPGLLGPSAVYRFQKNPIELFLELRQRYGDIVGYRLGGTRFALLFDPKDIERVFMDTTGAFERDEMMRALSRVTGKGLFSIDGEVWRRHRRLMAPAMRRTAIHVHASASVSITRDHLERWGEQSVRQVYPDMMRLSMDIAAKSLLNLDIPDEVMHLLEGVDAATDYLMRELMGLWRLVPGVIPAPHRRRFARARVNMLASVERCIERRRSDGVGGHDLLQLLLAARDEDGSQLSESELKDEILTMIVAGYETTGLALTYCLHAIASQPELQARLQDELRRVLCGEDATAESTKALELMRAVVDESLRLYPPVWVVARQVAAPVVVGGYELGPGTQVLMPPSVVQRDPRWWKEPDQFVPERWLESAARPRFAHFPFGGGARTCIGNHFALQSITLVLATLLQRVELELQSARELRFAPSVTLRPSAEIRLAVRVLPEPVRSRTRAADRALEPPAQSPRS